MNFLKLIECFFWDQEVGSSNLSAPTIIKIMQKNIFEEIIEECCSNPITGFYRDGFCNTDQLDFGTHTVCTLITNDFLEFSKSMGNDLSTPRPEFDFPGLKEGDKWCVCANRWLEAYENGKAPMVYLRKSHKKSISIIDIEILKKIQSLLKDDGFTIEGAKKHLKSKVLNDEIKIISELENIKKKLIDLKRKI